MPVDTSVALYQLNSLLEQAQMELEMGYHLPELKGQVLLLTAASIDKSIYHMIIDKERKWYVKDNWSNPLNRSGISRIICISVVFKLRDLCVRGPRFLYYMPCAILKAV